MRIVFVGGAMRSGTTILGEMLAHGSAVFNAGEIARIWVELANDGPCSCGVTLRACPVWGAALEAWLAERGGAVDLDRLSVDSLTTFRLRSMNRYGRRINGDQGQLNAAEEAVLAATSAVTANAMTIVGADVLIDTSKRVSWMQMHRLAHPDARISLVHLVRDVRGVAASSARPWSYDVMASDVRAPRPVGLTHAVLRWSRLNLTTLRGRLWADDACMIRYEDLMQDPARVMNHLASALGLELDGTLFDRKVYSPPKRHVVAGNPHRLNNASRRLAPDERWKHELSALEQLTVLAMAAPARWAIRSRRQELLQSG